MSAINEPLNIRTTEIKRISTKKYPLAGKKPLTKKKKPIVSEAVKLKPRPIRIHETE